jgi:hypothetical protein
MAPSLSVKGSIVKGLRGSGRTGFSGLPINFDARQKIKRRQAEPRPAWLPYAIRIYLCLDLLHSV